MAIIKSLITVEEITNIINGKDAQIIDVRPFSKYIISHIPKAIWFWLWDLVDNVKDVLKPKRPEEIAKILGNNGIRNDLPTIIYSSNQNFAIATYLAWYLKYVGIKEIKILIGGFEEYSKKDLPIEKRLHKPQPQDFHYTLDSSIRANLHDIINIVNGKQNEILIDVRTHEEFTGEFTITPKPGRIPKSINTPPELYIKTFENNNIDNNIIKILEHVKNRGCITYCATGERASLAWFIFKMIFSIKNVKLYPESFQEYSSIPNLPIEVG
jgi:thiosulfate/3-mercaptopyruvate sulfurtransferase